MKTKFLLTLCFIILHSSFILSTRAQGTAFTYQGRLNESGGAANGTYDLQFTIYDALAGGSQIGGKLTSTATAVSNGLFTVTLDFGANFPGAGRWLEIAVRTNGGGAFTNLIPRQPITATPYAIRAANAATASGAPWSGLTGLPAGFADGVDNDTTYLPGAGLSLTGPTFSLNLSYTDARYWKLTGNGSTTPGANFLGTADNQALELQVNSQRALRLEPGATSPNVVGGYFGNASSGVQGGFIGGGGAVGALNTLSNNYAAIVGGSLNQAVGLASFVGGGSEHEAIGDYGVVAGGFRNTASGYSSAVAGGVENTAGGADAFVGGGGGNYAGGNWSMIGGGLRNKMFAGNYAFMGGGYENFMNSPSDYAVIGGGKSNTNRSSFTVIGGGSTNSTTGLGAVIAGGSRNEVSASYGVVGGGYFNLNNETNGTISGGSGNRVAGNTGGSIGGGVNNFIALAQAGTIAGGIQNHIFDNSAVAVVGGGYQNFIEGNGVTATIGGGYFNFATTPYSTIGGGYFNTNAGSYATVPGGARNRAAGDYSLAAGRRAKADHDGSFVWADDTDANFSSTTTKQFALRANNGVMIQAGNTALDLRGGGAVRVAGAGLGTSTPVFIHRAATNNFSGYITTIDHPHCNNDPNAILIVTPNWNPGGVGGVYNASAIGVYYAVGRWRIFNQDRADIATNAAFNVLVFKP